MEEFSNFINQTKRNKVFAEKVIHKLVKRSEAEGAIPPIPSLQSELTSETPTNIKSTLSSQSSQEDYLLHPFTTTATPVIGIVTSCTKLQATDLEATTSADTSKIVIKHYGPEKPDLDVLHPKKLKSEPQTEKNRKRKLKKKRRKADSGNSNSVSFSYLPKS